MSAFKEGQVVYTLLDINSNHYSNDMRILKGIVRSHKTLSNADPEQREVYGIEDENGNGHMRYEWCIFGSLQALKEYVENIILGDMRDINTARVSYKKYLDAATKQFRKCKEILDKWYETCAKEARNEQTWSEESI